MVVRKRVEGQVQQNDGEFAEAQTNGIEGIETNLVLGTIQIHREETDNTPEEFQRRFPVGKWLDVLTITEITAQPPGTRGRRVRLPLANPYYRE